MQGAILYGGYAAGAFAQAACPGGGVGAPVLNCLAGSAAALKASAVVKELAEKTGVETDTVSRICGLVFCAPCVIGRVLSHVDALRLEGSMGVPDAANGGRKSAVVAPRPHAASVLVEVQVNHAGPIGIILVQQPQSDAVGVEALKFPANASLSGTPIQPGDILHAVNGNNVAFAGYAGVLAALAVAKARPLRLTFLRQVQAVAV
jgi:hypothetical protein